jgi:transposase-like protein
MKGKPTPTEIKNLIIQRVKQGDKIDDLAIEFKLYPNTIRKWLAKEGVSGISATGRNQRSTALLLAKAQREKQQLMEIIGKLTVQLEQSKKKSKLPTSNC